MPDIANSTRIWEANIHWTVFSHCGVWDPKGRGVDIWECLVDHYSSKATQPPHQKYWRYIARR